MMHLNRAELESMKLGKGLKPDYLVMYSHNETLAMGVLLA